MSFSSKRNRRRATFIGAFIGFVIIFTFMLTLVAPDAAQRNSSSDSADIYATPVPTSIVFPTPEADPQIAGELPYIHSTGYFQTFRPAGTDWVIDEGGSVDASAYARVVIQSGQRLAVIHNYIQPGVEYESLDRLSTEFLTPEHFAGAWTDYEQWTETGRTVTEDSVIVNFDLVSGGLPYLARVTAKLDGSWLFMSRLVVPANNPALLDLLHDQVTAQFYGYHDLLALPQTWPAYVDQQAGFAFKYPAEWSKVAGDPGRPVTFSIPGAEGKNLVRIWSVPGVSIASEEDASAWVIATDPSVQVLDVQPLTHEWDAGFLVAYTYSDTAGNTHSGLYTLLNDDGGMLFIANLQTEPSDLDLGGGQDLAEPFLTARQAVTGGFVVLPDDARQVPAAQ